MALRRLFIWLLLVFFVLTSLTWVCAKTALAETKQKKVQLNLCAAAFGSRLYLIAVGSAEVLKKKHPWLRAFAMETHGAMDNVKWISAEPERRKTSFGASMVGGVLLAIRGLEPFKKSYPTLRAVQPVGGVIAAFMSLDPKIKTPRDLVGKKIGCWPRGHGVGTIGVEIMKAWGIFDKVNVKYLRPNAMRDALRDGLLDVVFASGVAVGENKYVGSPWVADILTRKRGYFVPVSKETLDKVAKDSGVRYLSERVEAKVLSPNQPEPITAVMGATIWFCHKDVPEQWIYEYVKTITDNTNLLAKFHVSAKVLSPANMGRWIGVKRELVHPGALKFYDERGIKLGAPR